MSKVFDYDLLDEITDIIVKKKCDMNIRLRYSNFKYYNYIISDWIITKAYEKEIISGFIDNEYDISKYLFNIKIYKEDGEILIDENIKLEEENDNLFKKYYKINLDNKIDSRVIDNLLNNYKLIPADIEICKIMKNKIKDKKNIIKIKSDYIYQCDMISKLYFIININTYELDQNIKYKIQIWKN